MGVSGLGLLKHFDLQATEASLLRAAPPMVANSPPTITRFPATTMSFT